MNNFEIPENMIDLGFVTPELNKDGSISFHSDIESDLGVGHTTMLRVFPGVVDKWTDDQKVKHERPYVHSPMQNREVIPYLDLLGSILKGDNVRKQRFLLSSRNILLREPQAESKVNYYVTIRLSRVAKVKVGTEWHERVHQCLILRDAKLVNGSGPISIIEGGTYIDSTNVPAWSWSRELQNKCLDAVLDHLEETEKRVAEEGA